MKMNIFRKLALDLAKRGQMGLVTSVVIGLVVVGIVLAIGSQIVSTTQSQQTVNSAAYNNTAFALTGIGTIAQWLPTIALVFAAVVVLGAVYLIQRGRK